MLDSLAFEYLKLKDVWGMLMKQILHTHTHLSEAYICVWWSCCTSQVLWFVWFEVGTYKPVVNTSSSYHLEVCLLTMRTID